MQVIGKDKDGHLIGVQRGLLKTTVYRGYVSGLSGLGDIDDLGKIDWTSIFTGINGNPLLIALGNKIGGGNSGVVPIDPYYGSRPPPPPSSSPGINPTYLMLGIGALALVMMMKR